MAPSVKRSTMKTYLSFTLLVALAGCTSVSLPPEASTVALVPVPSKSVAVYQPRFIMVEGRLNLDGWVYRQFDAPTTATSHIDIVFLDAAGRELRGESTDFAPRDLRGGGHRMRQRGHYSLPIPVMPAGTSKIEVRAHDGAHN